MKGKLIVVSGPSGCGKGTVLKRVLSADSNIFYSVSATTRSPRTGEVDGVHYYFITREEFEEMIKTDGMLEYAEYVGNYYGTPKQTVSDALSEGKDVILEIEVKGAKKIKEKCPDAIFVFIKPPSLEELQRRLIGRGTEKIEVINKRLKKAAEEMANESLYDYVVVNDDIDTAACDIAAIIRSEKLKR